MNIASNLKQQIKCDSINLVDLSDISSPNQNIIKARKKKIKNNNSSKEDQNKIEVSRLEFGIAQLVNSCRKNNQYHQFTIKNKKKCKEQNDNKLLIIEKEILKRY